MKPKYPFVILFVIIISIPTLFLPFYESSTASENRAKDKFPEWYTLYTYPVLFIRKVDAFYKSNFALRNHLYNFYKYLKWDILGENPFPNEVVVGKDGWLFPGNKSYHNYDQSLGVVSDIEERMDSTCCKMLAMKTFCDSLGIDFYLAIGPDKASVYPEMLPIKPLTVGKTKDVVKRKLKRFHVNVIDMSDYILEQKDGQKLYFYKTDTHWNHLGAYLGTQRLLDEIRKKYDVGTIDLNDYQVKDTVVFTMDLSRQIDVPMKESYSVFKKQKDDYTKTIRSMNYDGWDVPLEETINVKRESKCVVFRDSYFQNMYDYFCNNVGHAVIGVQRFDRNLILKVRPDFVVFELVERRLLDFDPNEFYL